MTVELRPATARDADTVATVLLISRRTFLPYLPSPRTDDEIRAWVRDGLMAEQHVAVAEVDGAVAGFVASHDDHGGSWISHLYLLPGHTGRGIGAALLDYALEFASRPVRLWAFQQNEDARRFYERRGFKPVRFTDGRDNEERMPDVLYQMDEPRRDPVVLAEYSPAWPGLFAEEERLLRHVLASETVAIEHVGSTSVPGLVAKPVIDILLGVPALAEIEKRLDPLRRAGFRYVPEFERTLPARRYFVKPDRRSATVHLHAVEQGGAFWRDQLDFRDTLRGDRRLFAEYEALKRRLATQFPDDREAYTEAKASFIRAAL